MCIAQPCKHVHWVWQRLVYVTKAIAQMQLVASGSELQPSEGARITCLSWSRASRLARIVRRWPPATVVNRAFILADCEATLCGVATRRALGLGPNLQNVWHTICAAYETSKRKQGRLPLLSPASCLLGPKLRGMNAQ
jgi:hypothetical protein